MCDEKRRIHLRYLFFLKRILHIYLHESLLITFLVCLRYIVSKALLIYFVVQGQPFRHTTKCVCNYLTFECHCGVLKRVLKVAKRFMKNCKTCNIRQLFEKS